MSPHNQLLQVTFDPPTTFATLKAGEEYGFCVCGRSGYRRGIGNLALECGATSGLSGQ
jgi:hypothetical protein